MNPPESQLWDENELVMVSALEHWAYCPRQCALIHVEQTFDENIYTLRGRLLHEKADQPTVEVRQGVRIERAMPIWSDRLGLIGKADVVEFRGLVPYPVEYKHGRRRSGAAVLQLCAQAMCLEEMTGQAVPQGAVYYHGARRRREIDLTEAIRSRVIETIAEVRQMLRDARLPPPVSDSRCRNCSLKESCMPSVVGKTDRVREVIASLFQIADP